jgi:hypothetical protein
MSFFQNPFNEDFEGNWLLADRKHIPKFVVKRNAGRGAEVVVSYGADPYNLSGNDSDGAARNILNICFCLHNTKNWATVSVDVTTNASNINAVTNQEIANSLNANALFSERFVANIGSFDDSAKPRLTIKQKKPVTEFKFYIKNGQAEDQIKFNAKAGVSELPTYFNRHTISNRFNFEDSEGMLVYLNPSLNIDAGVINNAVDFKGNSLGYNSASVTPDWKLLEGRSGLFIFSKITVDGSDRVTSKIEYSAGSKEGDLAKKITYTYTGANKTPNTVAEIPYTLTSSDLVTP